jgi:pimeloyl-[acyl-carrier protein] methyl ester esterase
MCCRRSRKGWTTTTDDILPTVVLLHALPLDGSMWPAELRELAPRVLAPTLYPLGETIEAWATAVLELAGPGPLVLIGTSIGGSCAIEVAALAPERVRQLVLIGAKPGHRPEPDARDTAVRLLAQHGMRAAWPEYWRPATARSSA